MTETPKKVAKASKTAKATKAAKKVAAKAAPQSSRFAKGKSFSWMERRRSGDAGPPAFSLTIHRPFFFATVGYVLLAIGMVFSVGLISNQAEQDRRQQTEACQQARVDTHRAIMETIDVIAGTTSDPEAILVIAPLISERIQATLNPEAC